MDVDTFTQTAAVWLRVNSAYGGCPLPQGAQRPGPAGNILFLAGVAVVGGGDGGVFLEWIRSMHASKHNLLCLS